MPNPKRLVALFKSQQDIPKLRRIDGKFYEKHSFPFTKRGALKDVRKLHREGYHTRVVRYLTKYGNDVGYAVYKRRFTTKTSPRKKKR